MGLFILAITRLTGTVGAGHDQGLDARQDRNLRGLEDAGYYEYDNNGDDNYNNTFATIEHDVETTLKDMFYNPPSEWSGLHWAFFACMVAIVSVSLCFFAACIISSCCCPRGGGKPLVVRTQDEHDRYTDELMRNDDDGFISDHTDELTDDDMKYRRGRVSHGHVEDESDYSGEPTDDYDSASFSTEAEESSFDDECIRRKHLRVKKNNDVEQNNDFEYANSHADYHGPNRRQLC